MLINHFISRREHLVDRNRPDIIVSDNLDKFHEQMKNHDEIGLDTENNSLHPILCTPLLIQFAFRDNTSFIIDRTSIKEDFLTPYKKKKYVGVNLQYDHRVIKWHYGVDLRNFEDIMVTEQILGRGSGRSNSYENIHLRRLNRYLPEDKYTRNDFISMGNNSQFLTNHIIYAGYDPFGCLEIRDIQQEIIDTYGLRRRVYDIAQPLVPILGDMCLNGFTLNTTKWSEILSENKIKKFELECKLDEIIRNWAPNYLALRGGIWTNIRKKKELYQQNLFGEATVISNENVKNVSYSSPKQLIKLFTILREPIPKKIDKETERKSWDSEKPMKDSFAEEALEQYKIQYPSSRVTEFINKLLEYRTVEKAINSFGEIFLKDRYKAPGKNKKYKVGFMNPITNKVHTIYKQEFTKNGRLSSGEVRIGFYNSQQVIKEARYRNCFTLTQKEIDEGWYISTYDLSGAELVILASNSKDKILTKIISEDKDLHSYLCSTSYTKIFKYILNTMSSTRAFDEIANLLKPNRVQFSLLKEVEKGRWEPYTAKELSQIHSDRINQVIQNGGNFVMDKNLHVDLRDPAKNAHYGINYGAGESKIAETLNMAPYYSKLYLEGIDDAIPEAMAYLKDIAKFGVRHGYVVFNTRTNSRHWFKVWLDAVSQGRQLSNKDKSSIERACKNYGISGTQADMIKEGMVNIDKYRLENNLPFEWLLQVHDELVFKHKVKEFGKEAGKMLTDTCNLYLEGIEMKVSGHTSHCWHK